MGYRVTAPLVIAHTPRGDQYVQTGGFLPDDTDADQLEQLVDSKMVAEDDAPVSPGHTPGDKPAGNAGAEEWRAYAIAQGMTEDDADGMSRDELRDHFNK